MLSAFRNLRLSIKVIVPMALLALVALGSGAFMSRALMATDTAYSTLLEGEAMAATHAGRLNLLTIDLARAVWRAVAFPEPVSITASVTEIEVMARQFTERSALVRSSVTGTPLAADLAALDRDFPVLQAVGLRSLRMLQAGQVMEAKTLLRAEFYDRIAAMRAVNRHLMDSLLMAANARSRALTEESHAAVRNALLILGIGILLSVGFALWLTQATILRPFAALDRNMQRLAGGDLSAEVVGTDRGDEIGGMARALQGFATGLRETTALRADQEAATLRATQERRAGLESMAANLEQTIGSVVGGISSAATELTAAANSMVGIAESASSRANTVSNASAEASGNVNTVAAATEELAASVAEISRRVADSARMSAGAVEQANRTNTSVANLTEAATKISEVTRLIGDIAGQTNLLALNATIEAARAGEAGKGFAVVASEVKALANQTAQATGSIASQIQAMQAATQEAATDIGAIRDSISQINEVTSAIAAAVEEQGAATRDIAHNVQRAASGTAEIASAIEGVTIAASETGGAASQVQTTSATLAEQADTLKREVGNFLGRMRAA